VGGGGEGSIDLTSLSAGIDELKYPRVRYGGGGVEVEQREGAAGSCWALLLPLCNRQNPGATRKPRERGGEGRAAEAIEMLEGREAQALSWQLSHARTYQPAPTSPQWGLPSSTSTVVSLPGERGEGSEAKREKGPARRRGCVCGKAVAKEESARRRRRK
jgi:hypothetical protein